MKKLSRGGSEALYTLILCAHALACVPLILVLGLWVIPVVLASYFFTLGIWYRLSRDEWVKILVIKAATGKITYMNNYYYVSDADYYFKITLSDMLVVYQPGKLPIYSKAGIIAVDVLKHVIKMRVS